MNEKSSTPSKWDAQLRKGSLELVIMSALKPKPMYGLELLTYLHQFDSMQITEGTLYPLMDRLKRDRLIEATWVQEGDARPRKYYALSADGAVRLKQLIARWQQSILDIETIITKNS